MPQDTNMPVFPTSWTSSGVNTTGAATTSTTTIETATTWRVEGPAFDRLSRETIDMVLAGYDGVSPVFIQRFLEEHSALVVFERYMRLKSVDSKKGLFHDGGE